jgi:hypothetical protein
MQMWREQEEAWKAEADKVTVEPADKVTVEPTKPKRKCNDEEAQPPKKVRKKHELTVVLNKKAVTKGLLAEDMGGILRPSLLPKRGVSRNHRGSQLCSRAWCNPHPSLFCGSV